MFDNIVVIFGRFGLLLSLLFCTVALLFAVLPPLLLIPFLLPLFPVSVLCARGFFVSVKTKTQKLE